jgi:hypothetical protein
VDEKPAFFTDHYNSAVNAAFQKMKQYYTITDDTRLYRMALALHPMARCAWFTNNWTNQPGGEQDIANAIVAVNDCWHEYLASRDASQAITHNVTSISLITSTTTAFSIPQTSIAPATAYTTRFYELMGFKQARRRDDESEGEKAAAQERERLRIRGEFDRFTQAELDLTAYEHEPLRWWQERGKHEYPTLAGLAFTVFAMPAMSAECERSFSRAGKMVTDDRYCLRADIIEADQLLKSWLVSGLINRETAWRVLDEIEQQALLEQQQPPLSSLESSSE